jgi:hypothetical protein
VLSVTEEIEYLALLEQEEREIVAPKFEEWRNPYRYKIAYGGRGAGAKSWSAGSLLVQFCEDPQYFGERVRVLCVREVQKSLDESSWRLIKNTIERLRYHGWTVTKNQIRNDKNGSMFAFEGLNDLSKDNLKSYEDFDILFAEEAAPISYDSWHTILPTFRKKNSEIWALFNRNLERDPVYDMFVLNRRPNSCILDLKSGEDDNPWWDQTTLQAEKDEDYKRDPDEAEHIWEGLPRKQAARAIFSRAQVRAMEDREIFEDENSVEEIGCDVARFGHDKTEAYRRKGMRVVEHRSIRGAGTNEVAAMLWDMAGHSDMVPVKVDSGYNPGVIDAIRVKGMRVIPIGFGETARDPEKYPNAASEMAFEFPIDRVSMPKEMITTTLFEDLTERLYGYDNKDRRKIEQKDGTTMLEDGNTRANFKGRHGGRSPDEGDALFLTFYQGTSHQADPRAGMALAARRKR